MRSLEQWRELKELLGRPRSKTRTQKTCSRKGVNFGSLFSPCNLLWELQGFDTTRQLCVDHFHNVPEGHAALFVALFFDALSEEARLVVQAAFDDPDTWDPCASK